MSMKENATAAHWLLCNPVGIARFCHWKAQIVRKVSDNIFEKNLRGNKTYYLHLLLDPTSLLLCPTKSCSKGREATYCLH